MKRCDSCGAPYQGRNTCLYCGSYFETFRETPRFGGATYDCLSTDYVTTFCTAIPIKLPRGVSLASSSPRWMNSTHVIYSEE